MTNLPQFSRALLHPRYWLTWLGVGLLWLIVLLPYPIIYRIGCGLGHIAMRVMKRRTQIADRNLELCFPEMSTQARHELMVKNFESVGMGLMETGMAWFWPDSRVRALMQVEGEEHVRAAVAAGEGMLLLSCHLLTLELNARMFGLLRPGIGVYRPNTQPVLEYAQVRGRTRSNKALVDRKDIKGMIKALRQGEALWYAPDHDYGRHASVFVPFFAVEQTATVTGTATLARVKNARVLPCYTLRLPKGGYQLVIGAPLENYPCGDELQDARRSNEVVEEAVRRAPEQYMWLHRRFKTPP